MVRLVPFPYAWVTQRLYSFICTLTNYFSLTLFPILSFLPIPTAIHVFVVVKLVPMLSYFLMSELTVVFILSPFSVVGDVNILWNNFSWTMLFFLPVEPRGENQDSSPPGIIDLNYITSRSKSSHVVTLSNARVNQYLYSFILLIVSFTFRNSSPPYMLPLLLACNMSPPSVSISLRGSLMGALAWWTHHLLGY